MNENCYSSHDYYQQFLLVYIYHRYDRCLANDDDNQCFTSSSCDGFGHGHEPKQFQGISMLCEEQHLNTTKPVLSKHHETSFVSSNEQTIQETIIRIKS